MYFSLKIKLLLWNMNLLINFLVKSCILAKDAQKEVDLHLDVREIAIPFFYVRYLWITSFGTIIHSPQKLWQGLDMKRIAIISAETRNSKKEVFFSWQSASLKTFSLSLIMVVRDEFFAINKVWFLAGVLCTTAHLLSGSSLQFKVWKNEDILIIPVLFPWCHLEIYAYCHNNATTIFIFFRNSDSFYGFLLKMHFFLPEN